MPMPLDNDGPGGDEDIDAAKSQIADDVSQYFAQLQEEEQRAIIPKLVNNVVPIRHTDTELVPVSMADAMFGKMVFDPEQALKDAAHESWILDDLIPAKGIGMIYGPPGSYKSFIALDMAASVSSGKDWHGYECEMPGGVVYIAAEGSRGLMERAVAWKRHHSRELGPLSIMPIAVMMDNALMVQAFTECLERATVELGVPIRMVFIDTMARSFNGDENSAQETGAFINACERFSSDIGDCMVMVVTHTGKDVTKGMRGSSALDGAAYCHFLVTKPNEGQALVKNTKQKDIEMAELMRFTMEPVSTGIEDRKGRIRRSLVPILESKGDDADPDAPVQEMTAFDHRERRVMISLCASAQQAGKPITEDELRKEFLAYLIEDQGKKEEAARKSWQRMYKATRADGGIMKAGKNIYPGETK